MHEETLTAPIIDRHNLKPIKRAHKAFLDSKKKKAFLDRTPTSKQNLKSQVVEGQHF
jgi:hypothetical protein